MRINIPVEICESENRMNIENIRCFISLAECLNFTRAAAREHITQTAMSRKISALEKELDVVLLYRDTRQVELTSAGNEFYPKAKELVRLYDDTVKQVQDAQNEFVAELKLGVGVYDHVLLNRFLGTYLKAQKQKIKISCMQEPYPSLAKDFEERLIDIIISTDQFEEDFRSLNAPQLGCFTIYDKDWYLILHKDNPLSKLEHIPIEALSTQTVINMHRGSREQVRKIFAPSFPLKESVFVDSFDTKLIMVNAGIGVAFAPPFVFPVADRYTNIVLKKTIPPYDARIFRAYYWKDNPNPIVLDFIRCYQKFCGEDAL